MTLKHRVSKLSGNHLSEPEIFFRSYAFENDDGSVSHGFKLAFVNFNGAIASLTSEPGETDADFRSRTFAEARKL